MNYSLTPVAEKDLEDIFIYIAKDSESRAIKFVSELEKYCDLLSQSPNIGRECPELKQGMKKFPVGNYEIFYRIRIDEIEIIRIIQGSQDIIPDLFYNNIIL